MSYAFQQIFMRQHIAEFYISFYVPIIKGHDSS